MGYLAQSVNTPVSRVRLRNGYPLNRIYYYKAVKFRKKLPSIPPVTTLDAQNFGPLNRIATGIKEFDLSVGSGLVADPF